MPLLQPKFSRQLSSAFYYQQLDIFLLISQYFFIFLYFLHVLVMFQLYYLYFIVGIGLIWFFFAYFKGESNLFHFKLHLNHLFFKSSYTYHCHSHTMECVYAILIYYTMVCLSNHKMKTMELLLSK